MANHCAFQYCHAQIILLSYNPDPVLISFVCFLTGVQFFNLKGQEAYGGHRRQALWQGADRCCCKDYKGELFDFSCTIDKPWKVMLTDVRSPVFKTWNKTVNQEVYYMLSNKNHSDIFKDDLLGPITFVGLDTSSL